MASTTNVTGPLLGSNAILSLGVQVNNNAPSVLYQHLRGGLDEVRIFGVARTQAEIQASRTSVLGGNEPGLVGYWNLNEGAGQTVANRAAAMAGGLNGTLGPGLASSPEDPSWNVTAPAPIVYCAPGGGQANSASASLRINGVGPHGVRGPFRIQVPRTGPAARRITLAGRGWPGATLLLGAGSLAASPVVVPCVGRLDLAPGFAVVGDFYTTPFPLNYLFVLDGNGEAELTFTVPASALGAGPWVALQGAVSHPGCAIPAVLTAAFELR